MQGGDDSLSTEIDMSMDDSANSAPYAGDQPFFFPQNPPSRRQSTQSRRKSEGGVAEDDGDDMEMTVAHGGISLPSEEPGDMSMDNSMDMSLAQSAAGGDPDASQTMEFTVPL